MGARAPARKPALEMKRKDAPPKKAPARKPVRAAPKKAVSSIRSFFLRFTLSVGLGCVMGGGVVGAALFRQALTVVDAGAVRPSWDVPGRVWSGPLELWPGLEASPEEIAADLAGAGYTRVSRATQPGDLQVGPDALIVVPRKASGPGWEVGGGPVLLGFGGGRISSVTPKGARFPPALMATVRGEDNENRSPVPAERIPQHVRDAVVAMEDGRFYEHFGLDPIGLGRAVVRNLQAGATVSTR